LRMTARNALAAAESRAFVARMSGEKANPAR
jgi:hypothetical protein